MNATPAEDARPVGKASVSPTTLSNLATELRHATTTHETVAPLRLRFPSLSVDDAYAIQRHQLVEHQQAGRGVVGHKIGLTSRAMQQQLGIDSPDFGYVLESMVYRSGATIPVSNFISPKVEPELAFLLDKPLAGAITRAEAVDAVGAVFAALEIIDSRVADWDIGLVDTIADNASCGAVVLGREPLTLDPGSTAEVGVDVILDGQVKEHGSGEAVLGDPIAPLVWLARTLDHYGEGLEQGQFVITGSFTRALSVTSGDTYRADFGKYGQISAIFS